MNDELKRVSKGLDALAERIAELNGLVEAQHTVICALLPHAGAAAGGIRRAISATLLETQQETVSEKYKEFLALQLQEYQGLLPP